MDLSWYHIIRVLLCKLITRTVHESPTLIFVISTGILCLFIINQVRVLLLLREDISLNPGPIRCPRTVCKKPVRLKALLCDKWSDNFQPMSVVPPIATKLLERIVSDQLYTFLEANEFLSPHRDAYRHGRSAEQILLLVSSTVARALDSGCFLTLLF